MNISDSKIPLLVKYQYESTNNQIERGMNDEENE
jgi:hypothetical protein